MGEDQDEGNSVFVDDDFIPYEDQWAFLASIDRVMPSQLQSLTATAAASGRILGVRLPIADEHAEPWTLPPSKRTAEDRIDTADLPKRAKVVIGNQLYIDRRNFDGRNATQIKLNSSEDGDGNLINNPGNHWRMRREFLARSCILEGGRLSAELLSNVVDEISFGPTAEPHRGLFWSFHPI